MKLRCNLFGPLLWIVVASGLAGCAGDIENGAPAALHYASLPAWPAQEYSSISLNGSNTVTGQAFLKTRGGDVKTAAGEQVTLTPKTNYSLSILLNYTKEYAVPNQGPPPEPDPQFAKFNRTQTADASGRFSFEGVPDGDYLIFTKVQWEAPTEYGLTRQGGVLDKTVHVVAGQKNDFILTE